MHTFTFSFYFQSQVLLTSIRSNDLPNLLHCYKARDIRATHIGNCRSKQHMQCTLTLPLVGRKHHHILVPRQPSTHLSESCLNTAV
ncbi:hypothetical protein BgiMline_021060 [Biomphalaria glabrata]|nr:hypothetical protein BgiMline_018220 [Biomphalaria glabrata]